MYEAVKKYLEENYEYDFQSEFWTDDNLVMLDEIITSTLKVGELFVERYKQFNESNAPIDGGMSFKLL